MIVYNQVCMIMLCRVYSGRLCEVTFIQHIQYTTV